MITGEAIAYAMTRGSNSAVNEILLEPTGAPL